MTQFNRSQLLQHDLDLLKQEILSLGRTLKGDITYHTLSYIIDQHLYNKQLAHGLIHIVCANLQKEGLITFSVLDFFRACMTVKKELQEKLEAFQTRFATLRIYNVKYNSEKEVFFKRTTNQSSPHTSCDLEGLTNSFVEEIDRTEEYIKALNTLTLSTNTEKAGLKVRARVVRAKNSKPSSFYLTTIGNSLRPSAVRDGDREQSDDSGFGLQFNAPAINNIASLNNKAPSDFHNSETVLHIDHLNEINEALFSNKVESLTSNKTKSTSSIRSENGPSTQKVGFKNARNNLYMSRLLSRSTSKFNSCAETRTHSPEAYSVYEFDASAEDLINRRFTSNFSNNTDKDAIRQDRGNTLEDLNRKLSLRRQELKNKISQRREARSQTYIIELEIRDLINEINRLNSLLAKEKQITLSSERKKHQCDEKYKKIIDQTKSVIKNLTKQNIQLSEELELKCNQVDYWRNRAERGNKENLSMNSISTHHTDSKANCFTEHCSSGADYLQKLISGIFFTADEKKIGPSTPKITIFGKKGTIESKLLPKRLVTCDS